MVVANNSRKIPIGVQNFEKLREDGYLYIDKTAFLYSLVHSGKQFFLSRPRRFGKSLFLSTLRAYWEGKRELFTGLSIEELEAGNAAAWQPYPIFYIDLNRDNYQVENSLERVLEYHLKEWEAIYGCIDPAASLAGRFQHLLQAAHSQTGRRCVILVDEYDKPLLEVIERPELEEHNKDVFKGFFSTLKSNDEDIQFVFITGVTKFNKVSIFSDLNQLNDISMTYDYAEICGITQDELLLGFDPEIRRLCEEQELSYEDCLETLKETYDGYHFHQKSAGVYNPFSLLRCFFSRDFGSYWFASGTPTFLVKRLTELEFDVRQFSDGTIVSTEEELSDYRGDNPNPVPLLYQTGYLTILGYDREFREYTLGFPNNEVKYGFLRSLVPEYLPLSAYQSGKDISSIRRYLEQGDTESLKNAFIALFASMPYVAGNQPWEQYFQTAIYLIFTLLGQHSHCEVYSAQGRADCIAETKKYVYLFEFKRDDTADNALKQIEEQGYALPYAADRRKIVKIGAAFDSEKRQLIQWKVSL